MSRKCNENQFQIVTNSPEQTVKLGASIGSALKGGEILALTGPLGSGKTHLIKGIASAARATDQNSVNSPTFVIVNEYHRPDGSLDIYHIDAYRIASIAEFERLGFDDLCYPSSVVLIEWADKVEPVLKNLDVIQVILAHVGPQQRKIKIKNLPPHICPKTDLPS